MKLPERKILANLPTPIFKLERSAEAYDHVQLYIKRDDFTGIEVSGNKVRKLEYVMDDALKKGCNMLITCGGLQSNHCRATAAAAAKLGMAVHLVLKGKPELYEGNFFLDNVFNASFTFISDTEYKHCRNDIMRDVKKDYEGKGYKPYIIPEGASDGLGMFGYYSAMEEILAQEKEMGIAFDTICIATGSGGTYAGLYLANEVLNAKKNIVGFNIYDKEIDFKEKIEGIIEESLDRTHNERKRSLLSYEHIHIINDYVGLGYGLSTEEEIAFIKKFAGREGIVLDPVYTGKAMYGLCSEIEKGAGVFYGNILFIHTGGIFGVFPKSSQFFKV